MNKGLRNENININVLTYVVVYHACLYGDYNFMGIVLLCADGNVPKVYGAKVKN
jgi:hypothetical protein